MKNQTSALSKVLGFIALVLAITVVKVVIRTGFTSAGVEASRLSGHSWDSAKPEIKQRITQQFMDFDLTEPVREKLVNCETDKYIAFLNTTGCSYQYNAMTTTKETHVANQDKCLEKFDIVKKAEEIDHECSKAHFPNDWAALRTKMGQSFQRDMELEFKKKGIPSRIPASAPDCIAGKVVTLLNESECRPIGMLSSSGKDCSVQVLERNQERFLGFVKSCAGQL